MKIKISLYVLMMLLFNSCEKILLGPESGNNASSNFEVLWNTIDKNYALFTVKAVNWDSLHYIYGSKIDESTTENELWYIVTDLLSNLNDGHVKLFNKNQTLGYNSSEIAKRKADDFSLELIKGSFLNNFNIAGSGLITYGKVKNKNIAYIHIASFASNSSSDGSWANDIDKILTELADCDAIIIDLRNNGGGQRVTCDRIVSSFIDRPITYFYQRTKTGPKHNDLSAFIPVSVSPENSKIRFVKRNVLLTNRFSASGSEYFTQVFKYLSYSTQIGDTTFGAFGDIISVAQLPNGWTFTYPCRLTTTPDGKCYEGKGIVPDHLVENTIADIQSGNDKVLKFAIDYLAK